jgi:hypothetical protein
MGLTCTYSAKNVFVQVKLNERTRKGLTYDAALQKQECVWIANIYLAFEEVDGEYRSFGGPAVEHDEERTLSAQIG